MFFLAPSQELIPRSETCKVVIIFDMGSQQLHNTDVGGHPEMRIQYFFIGSGSAEDKNSDPTFFRNEEKIYLYFR